MFGSIEDAFDRVTEVDDFVGNPVRYSLNRAVQPVTDSLEVLEGLSVGELRFKAAARLGADAVVGLGGEELIDLILDN